jgi:DNA adenine methylase
MVAPQQSLALAYERAMAHLNQSMLDDATRIAEVEYVCRNIQNRAGVRLLLACLLAKVHRPEVDVRKPYTEIGDADSFSGRTYDEAFIGPFIVEHHLPCNSTTVFLTPALRNRNTVLTKDTDLVGRPPKLYQTVLKLLDDVYAHQISAEDLMAETVRWLLVIREEIRQRTETLLAAIQSTEGGMLLSAETIVHLIEQHLHQPRSSRLPVLIVVAAYEAAKAQLGEMHTTLMPHNAADEQTQSLGDLEITLVDERQVITTYEMKSRVVHKEDIDRAIQKIQSGGKIPSQYVFITTESIDEKAQEYALNLYAVTQGIEFVILDCVSFLRHFLHLFHRLRMAFLEAYQQLVFSEPDSAVSQPV